MKLVTENQLAALVKSIASKLKNLSDKDATTASQITSLQSGVSAAQSTANSAATKADNAQATANDALSRVNTATGTPSQITASTTTQGIVQLVDDLTTYDDTKALTASQGKVLNDNKLDKNANAVSASRLANGRQIALTGAVTGSANFNGSTNVSIATTLNLIDFLNRKTENGYQKLPNGLIIQWGQHIASTNPVESSININFPTSFPNRCLNVSATRRMSQHSTAGDGGVLIVSTTTTGAVFSMQTFSTSVADLRGFDWIAIGY